MDILKQLEDEIRQNENADQSDFSSQNRISILKSILKIKKDNDKGMPYRKLLYLLLVKICIVLVELQQEEVIHLDLTDLDMIATKLGKPETEVDDLLKIIDFLLEDRYRNLYPILKLRDELIGLIYERLILERRD
ncbi:MAG: hypothetical protein WD266_09230 [Balneolales bacterium]